MNLVKIVMILAVFSHSQARAASNANLRFRVTVTNVTAGNVLSPPLMVVLKNERKLFAAGEAASAGLAQVAETGSTETLEKELSECSDLVTSAKAIGGPIAAGSGRSIEISIPSRAVKEGVHLNLIAMIGMSNDSFISTLGVPTVKLAKLKRGEGSIRFSATNYDAGSEENSGNVADFGPGGHPTDSAEGHISLDRGLNPRGDAPEILGWGTAAATVTLERL